MDHNEIRHKLSAYLDGTSSADEQTEIEEHIKTCEKCGDALRELRKTVEHIKTVEEVEPPVWMTQKIMAKVRADAEQKKSFSERLYSLFVVNLPIKAVAVLFLTAIAFFMYRDIRPQKFSETPLPAAVVKKEAIPSGTEKSAQIRSENAPLRAKQLAQKPEYKSLDMKLEYEKPAPPALQDNRAVSAPAAAQPFAAPVPPPQTLKEGNDNAMTQESRAVADRQGASGSSMGLAAREKPQLDGLARTSKAKTARAVEGGVSMVEIIVKVKNITSAQKEIEKITTVFGGKIVKTVMPIGTSAIIVSINAVQFAEFLSKLKTIGDINEYVPAPIDRAGYLITRITMTMN